MLPVTAGQVSMVVMDISYPGIEAARPARATAVQQVIDERK